MDVSEHRSQLRLPEFIHHAASSRSGALPNSLEADPLLYLDLERSARPAGIPPFRVGPYSYRDDHPLASERWGIEAHYLAARAEALLVQAPPGAM
jgi:hypothetical protein